MFSWFGGIAVDLREAQLAPDAHLEVALALRRHRDPRPAGVEGRVETSRRSPAASTSTFRSREADDAPTLEARRLRRFRRGRGRREADDELAVRRATSTSSRSPSGSFAPSPRRWAGRSTRRQSSFSRGSCGRLASTRRPRRTSSGSRSSSSAGSSARPSDVADELEQSPKKLAVRKAGGNVVELGSILAFGFSPLWLLAARRRRHARYARLPRRARRRAQGCRRPRAGAEFASVDDLLAALEGASGTTARLIDIPPLEVEGLKRSLADLRDDAKSLPTPPELAAVYQGLLAEADREQRSLLEVSVGMGLAFFNSARKVGRQHVLDPYTEDLRPLRDEGFAAYARRVGSPYAQRSRATLRPAPRQR